MARKISKILAIDPGTRRMGVAFLDKGKLIYHAVKVIKKGKSPHETLREGRRIILRLIRDLKPRTLAIEKAFFANNRNSALVNVFVDEIKAIAWRKKLKVKIKCDYCRLYFKSTNPGRRVCNKCKQKYFRFNYRKQVGG